MGHAASTIMDCWHKNHLRGNIGLQKLSEQILWARGKMNRQRKIIYQNICKPLI